MTLCCKMHQIPFSFSHIHASSRSPKCHVDIFKFCAEFCVYGEDSPDQVASGSRRNCGNTSTTWSWARNINQLHFLKGLHKNINQQSHHAVWSDLDSHIKVLNSRDLFCIAWWCEAKGQPIHSAPSSKVKAKNPQKTPPSWKWWRKWFHWEKICCVKNNVHGITFFQGVFEMFLQNLRNVTTRGLFFFLASRPRSLEESNDLENVWWFDHSKCLPLKQAAHQAPFQAALAWLYLGFSAVYQMIWESRKAKTHCQFKFVHSGSRKLPKETTWQKSILIIYIYMCFLYEW